MLHGPFAVSNKIIYKVMEFTVEKNKKPPKQSQNIDLVSGRWHELKLNVKLE